MSRLIKITAAELLKVYAAGERDFHRFGQSEEKYDRLLDYPTCENRITKGNYDFIDADLQGICLKNECLSGADLSGANLTLANLKGADFSNTRLGHTSFNSADLTGANFSESYLGDAEINRGAKLRNANFKNAYLDHADMRWAYFEETDLSGADMRAANLTGTDLRGMIFTEDTLFFGTNFSLADLRGKSFRNSNLGRADFKGADMRGVDFKDSMMGKSDFTRADIRGVKNLETALKQMYNCTAHPWDQDPIIKDTIVNKREEKIIKSHFKEREYSVICVK